MKIPTKKPAEPKKPAPPMPDVRHGDEIYFHIDGVPHDGKVVATGKHGATVQHGGKPRKVRWEHMLGHKTRAATKMRVISAGHDGAIVEDESGRRQFLVGYVSREEAEPPGNTNAEPEPYNVPAERGAMAKAGPMILLLGDAAMMKALANRPGLALKGVTDKGGHQTKRWKRTGADAAPADRAPAAGDKPKASVGDAVEFRMGSVSGKGEVIAAGKDGATVKDASGREHQVHWEEMQGGSAEGDDAPGKGAADVAPRASPTPAAASGGDRGGDEPSAPTEKSAASAPGADDGIVHPDHFHAASFAAAHDQPGVTPDDIIKGLPPEARAKVDKAEADLAKAEDTSTLFRKGGKWTAERAEMHKKIVAKILSPEKIAAAMPSDGEKPTFTILGGRGGSGKSKLHGVVFDPKKVIVLDNDEIKKMLPEYQGWNAGKLHIEASDIFKEITEIARDAGLNIVHDSTMVNQDATLGVVATFEEAGYRIEPHYMHVPRHVAAERSVGRFLDPKDGRYVPPSVVLGNTRNEATFDAVKSHSDKWSFRDNTGPKGSEPRLISQRSPGKSSKIPEKEE